jgi:hypothetical protein
LLDELEFRVLDLKNDMSQSLRLMKLVYGTDSEVSNPDFYKWQYQDNPEGWALLVGYFNRKGDLVSQVASIPSCLIVNGKPEIYNMTLNIATDPDYRGHHLVSELFTKIHKMFAKDFTFGMPNANSLSLHQRLGYYVLKIPTLYKVIRPTKLLSQNISAPLLDNLSFRANKKVLEKIKFLEQPIEANASITSRIFRSRSLSYLNWRFRSIPTRNYTIMRHNSHNDNYLIGRSILIDKKEIGVICEVQAVSRLVVKDLADAFCIHCMESSNTSVVIAGYFADSLQYQHLKSAGFHVLPYKFRPHPLALCVKQLSTVGSVNPSEVRNWFFSLGDFDVF